MFFLSRWSSNNLPLVDVLEARRAMLPSQLIMGPFVSHWQGTSCAQPVRVSMGTQLERSGTFCNMHAGVPIASSIEGTVCRLRALMSPKGRVTPASFCRLESPNSAARDRRRRSCAAVGAGRVTRCRAGCAHLFPRLPRGERLPGRDPPAVIPQAAAGRQDEAARTGRDPHARPFRLMEPAATIAPPLGALGRLAYHLYPA
eukprot:scaffold79846_cov75-Phaeocystis_antarctica.AAC.3